MFIVILKLKARRVIYPKVDEVSLMFKWTVSRYNSLIQNPWVFTEFNSPHASPQINSLYKGETPECITSKHTAFLCYSVVSIC